MKPKWPETPEEIAEDRKAMDQALLEIKQSNWRKLYARPDPLLERLRRLGGHNTEHEASRASHSDWQERWEDETLISP